MHRITLTTSRILFLLLLVSAILFDSWLFIWIKRPSDANSFALLELGGIILFHILVPFSQFLNWVWSWLHWIHFFFPFCFSGLALNPIDGILQAAPHTMSMFLVPTHFTTHMVLFFMEGLWTACIHDCIHGKLWPVMGAGYHTIHHTTYRHNYGHYTVFMDWLFGTLRTPAVGDEDKPKIS